MNTRIFEVTGEGQKERGGGTIAGQNETGTTGSRRTEK